MSVQFSIVEPRRERREVRRESSAASASTGGPRSGGDRASGESASGRSLGGAYWRLWTSAGLSSLADGVVKVAFPLVAIRFTRSPVLIAGLSFAVTLPWLLFALQAGALADRLDRRRAMLGANWARASLLVAALIAIALGAGAVWAVFLGALSSCGAATAA